jgi:steroid delta-isomerase-like uncharacterized protein
MPRFAFVLAVALFAIAPLTLVSGPFVAAQDATPQAACPQTSEEENAALALRWHEEAINGHDPGVIDEIFSDDVIHHAGTLPDGVGLEAVHKVLGVLLTGFPDVEHAVDDVIARDDKVVTRWTADGTHEGEFQGIAPTGKHVTWTGINIFRIECGKIAEEWSEVDGLGRIAQMEAEATPTP